MEFTQFASHDHEGVVLCPTCEGGQWIVRTRDDTFHLVDLDVPAYAVLLPGDAAGPDVRHLHELHRVRLGGTLSMRLSKWGSVADERVRTPAVVSVEPARSAREFRRACWAAGIVLQAAIDEVMEIAENLE